MNTKQINTIKTNISNSFKDIKLDNKSHTYSINGKTGFTSVTQFLEQFSTPFNAYMMSNIVANRYNATNPLKTKRNGQWYKRYWKAKADEACARGTRVHQFAEFYPDLPPVNCKQEKGIERWFDDLDKDIYEILFMELKMYDVKSKKAGTIDLILLNKETGKLIIVDWKTNFANLIQCYGNKKLKAPFKHVHDSKLNKYKLQLSTYKWMIEENTEYAVEDMWVVWLKSGDYETIDKGKSKDKYSILSDRPSVITSDYLQFNIGKDDYSSDIGLVLTAPIKKTKSMFGKRKTSKK